MVIDILLVVGGLIVGAVLGVLIARKLFKKELQKNPPINEDMIKALMRGMGRQPNQKQVNQLMNQMNKFNK